MGAEHGLGCVCWKCRGKGDRNRRAEFIERQAREAGLVNVGDHWQYAETVAFLSGVPLEGGASADLVEGSAVPLQVQGGSPTNSPPGSLQFEHAAERRAIIEEMGGGAAGVIQYARGAGSNVGVGGEDRLVVAAYVKWDDPQRVFADLDRAKESARTGGDGLIVLGDCTYAVKASGHRTEGGGPVYRWMLQAGGVTYSISRNAEPSGTMPNMMIDFGSLALMSADSPRDLYFDTVEQLADAGCRLLKAKPSRVDCCVDQPGVEVGIYTDLLRRRCFISRGRAIAEFESGCPFVTYTNGRKSTGFTIGKALMLRVYDKLAETDHQEAKRGVMIERRWGGVLPESATRIEFQTRREKLKEFGIDTMQDYWEKRGNFVAYLVGEWIQFTSREYDSRHTERAEVHALWADAQARFCAAFQGGWRETGGGVRLPKRFAPVCLDLKRQVLGCVTSIVAAVRAKIDDVEDLVSEVHKQVGEALFVVGENELLSKLRVKNARYNAAVPLPAGSS